MRRIMLSSDVRLKWFMPGVLGVALVVGLMAASALRAGPVPDMAAKAATPEAGTEDGPTRITNHWAIYVGSDPLEMTAAQDLKKALHQRFGVDVGGPRRVADIGPLEDILPERLIVIGTIKDNDLIETANHFKPIALGDSPESYHFVYRTVGGTTGDKTGAEDGPARKGNLFIVGRTAKGAMDGVYRFLDRGTIDVASLDEHASPAFRYRVGGYKMNQYPPANWSELDEARYLASHYINVVWGEKKGPPISYAARKKYGLGLMVEVILPPQGSGDWMKKPANASAVYYLKKGKKRRVISPFDPAGRHYYLEHYKHLLEENPDIKILYALFGDYSAIPGKNSVRVSDGKPYSHTHIEGMKEMLKLMRQAVGDRPDIYVIGWMWHSFWGDDKGAAAFMQELAGLGFGAMYNEHGNNDDWIFKYDNYDKTAIKAGPDGKTVYGPRYLPLVSAGGSCESINPVIGFPLPHVAEHKIRVLTDLGVNNFATWWLGYPGWVYEPNNEVVSEMIWNPQAFDASNTHPFDPDDPEPVLEKIAVRDFGAKLAPAILKFWGAFDHALVTHAPLYRKPKDMPPPDQDGLHIYDWYQRMGIFTEKVFGGPYPLPLTPENLLGRRELKKKDSYWGFSPLAHENYQSVIGKLRKAVAMIQAIHDRGDLPDAPAGAAKRVADMYRWTDLYVHLLTSQYNWLRALTVAHKHPEWSADADEWREPLKPIIDDEIANDRALIELIPHFPPNFNIRQSMEGVVTNQGSVQDELAVLHAKVAAMRLWRENLPNVARGKSARASSLENGGAHRAKDAFDGRTDTRWSSAYSDDQWIYVDLGRVMPIEYVVLVWNPAYAKRYEIQVADRLDDEHGNGRWKTVYATDAGHGATEVIPMPDGAQARYVRMKGIERATRWGYSLEEFKVFGPKQ